MTDYFELFHLARTPSINPDQLKQTFLKHSARVHPDRFHQATPAEKERAHAAYTLFNQAYQCLRNPKDRLLHLIQLESGKPPPEVLSIPHETTDLFMEVGSLCQQTDRFLKDGRLLSSPLLKVAWFQESQARMDSLQGMQDRLNQWKTSLENELASLDPAWNSAPPIGDPGRSRHLPLTRLEQLYRVLSYASRWSDQLRERHFQLSSALIL